MSSLDVTVMRAVLSCFCIFKKTKPKMPKSSSNTSLRYAQIKKEGRGRAVGKDGSPSLVTAELQTVSENTRRS